MAGFESEQRTWKTAFSSFSHSTTIWLLRISVRVVTIVGTIWSFFIHAKVRIRLGPLEWLISTPAFHHWHHTNDQHRDRNFAAIFPVIDLIFGTSWLPKHWRSKVS